MQRTLILISKATISMYRKSSYQPSSVLVYPTITDACLAIKVIQNCYIEVMFCSAQHKNTTKVQFLPVEHSAELGEL